MTKPVCINYLEADASARATAILKDLLGSSGTPSVGAQREQAAPALLKPMNERFEMTLSPTMMDVMIERDAFDPEGVTFHGTEWFGHRKGPLPRTLGEVAARLELWIEEVGCRSPSELIEQFDRGRQKALRAAVAAALLKDETCFMTKVQLVSHSEIAVEYSGNHSSGRYSAGGMTAGRPGATMSPNLYGALGAYPYHVSITGKHWPSLQKLDLAFWEPQVLIFDEHLSVTDRLRLIAYADDADFRLIDEA